MTYSLIDRLADIGTPTAEEAIAQLAAKDALIREMVGAAKGVSGALNAAFAAGTEEREGGSGSRQGKYIDKYEAVRKATNAALTRAKELGYE